MRVSSSDVVDKGAIVQNILLQKIRNIPVLLQSER